MGLALFSHSWCYLPPKKSPAPQPGSPATRAECCPRSGQLGWTAACASSAPDIRDDCLPTTSCCPIAVQEGRGCTESGRGAHETDQPGRLGAVSGAGGSAGPWRCLHRWPRPVPGVWGMPQRTRGSSCALAGELTVCEMTETALRADTSHRMYS